MIDASEDWPYDEFGNLKDRIDLDFALQGDGWDQPDNPFDRANEEVLNQKINTCDCNLADFKRAVSDLYSFLNIAPNKFPNNKAQLDSFRSIGGYAAGTWSVWVDVDRSLIGSTDNMQFIFLGKGCEKYHYCKLTYSSKNNIEIVWPNKDWVDQRSSSKRASVRHNLSTKSTEELLDEIAVPVEDQLPAAVIEEILSDATIDEFEQSERLKELEELDDKQYDRRTYGHLDEAQTQETGDKWLEAGFSDEVSFLFRINKLMPEDVFELMKFMPQAEVRNWVTQFEQNSLAALDLLKLSREYTDDIPTAEFELKKKYSQALSESIRTAVSLQLQNWLRGRSPSRKR